MPASTRPGWEYNSDGKLEATFRQNVLRYPKGDGTSTYKNNIVVVANTTTGGYDAYYDERSAVGISAGRIALYSFNPNTGRITPYEKNRELFDRVYPGGVTDPQLQALNKDTKNGVISNLQLNATDPIDQANLKKIRELEGYKTQSNVLPISNPDSETDQDEGDGQTPSSVNRNQNTEEETNPILGAKLPESLSVNQRPSSSYEKGLTYPETLTKDAQDYLKIQMVEYTPRGLTSEQNSFALGSRANIRKGGELPEGRKILSSIFLPIPGGVSDSNNANWSKGDMDPIKGTAANLAYQSIQGKDVAETVTKTIENVKSNTNGLKALVTQSIIKELTGIDVLRRQQGAIINQNSELLFDGPGLRTFSFTYKFSPRGPNEATTVKKIIRTLKQGMSPKKANNFLFIKSPHTFFLSYHLGTEIHPFLNKFKECALTSLSVNYTPDGSYATYYDGSMVSYQVTMTFQELEPIFDSDYGQGYNNIGF